METSWHHWWRSQRRQRLCWTPNSQTRKGSLGRWKSKALLASVTMRPQPGLQESRLCPLQDLLGIIPQGKPLEGREVLESSLIRKDHFLKSSNWSILNSRKSNKSARSQNSNIKKGLCRKRKLGQVAWKEYRGTVQEYRDVVRQATAHLDWNLLGGVYGYLFISIWNKNLRLM